MLGKEILLGLSGSSTYAVGSDSGFESRISTSTRISSIPLKSQVDVAVVLARFSSGHFFSSLCPFGLDPTFEEINTESFSGFQWVHCQNGDI